MSGIVLLTLQLGVAIGGFVGMSSLLGWYNKESKGGTRNESRNHKSGLH